MDRKPRCQKKLIKGVPAAFEAEMAEHIYLHVKERQADGGNWLRTATLGMTPPSVKSSPIKQSGSFYCNCSQIAHPLLYFIIALLLCKDEVLPAKLAAILTNFCKVTANDDSQLQSAALRKVFFFWSQPH